MTRRRHFSRHRIALGVRLRVGHGWLDATTIDVSRAGMFLRTSVGIVEGRVIQVQITLPGEVPLTVLGRVRRSVEGTISGKTVPGLGVEFLSLSREARQQWDDFIFEQSKRSKQLAAVARRRTEAQAATAATGTLAQRRDLPVAFLKVRPPDDEALQAFARRRRERTGLTLRTDVAVEIGQRVELALVHHATDAELQLHGLVAHFERDRESGRDTVTLRWSALAATDAKALTCFVETGTRGRARLGLEARQELEALRKRAFSSGDKPDVWVALGWALLDSAEAFEKGAEAFSRALAIDSERQDALHGLALCRALSGQPGDALRLVRLSRRLRPHAGS